VGGEADNATAVFGLTTYNGENYLAEALESLLAQSRRDLAVVVVDDCSTDGTRDIATRYAGFDERVSYVRNDRRLGLVRNWRRAFELAGERAPRAPYFAWASDHDVWHPRWLEALAAELDAHPEAVLAYPLSVRIDDAGAEYPTREQRFATAGLGGSRERLRRTARELTAAGELIYGLVRREALERCGPFPLVVLPDRLQLARLSIEGQFRQVPRLLWARRYRAGVAMSNARQRRAVFPDGIPLGSYLPWWLTHARLLLESLDGNADRWPLAGILLRESIRHARSRRRERAWRERRWRRRGRRRRFRGLVRTGLVRHGLRVPRAHRAAERPQTETLALPDAETAMAALGRASLLDELGVPGAVVLELEGPTVELRDRLRTRFPELVYESVTFAELATAAGGRIDLALSIGSFGRLTGSKLAASLERLYELGAPALYSLDRESTESRTVLGRWYWLRDVWVPGGRVDGRKPDPSAGPVPRVADAYRHVVGRRRLVPELELHEARMRR
jgi:glycosyltransferase involved in cell wall biosynthesis